MVDNTKSFSNINCLGQCAKWETWLIKPTDLFYLQEVGGRIWWSGWDGIDFGWVREEASSVLVAEGVLRP